MEETTRATAPQKYLFDVAAYHKMAEAKIIPFYIRVELIEGEIIQMAPIGPIHAAIVTTIAEYFYATVGQLTTVRVQNPIVLGDLSEPEPDIVLARRYAHRYKEKHPTPEDILLLLEVADSSFKLDKETKIPLYAKHGICEVWLVDVKNLHVDVYTIPTSKGYENVKRFKSGQQITSSHVPDLHINVDDIII